MKKENFIIRKIKITDAEAFLNLRLQSERETEMMAYRKGERKETVEEMRKKIEKDLKSKSGIILVAESNKIFIGFFIISGNNMKVYSKARGVALAVLKNNWGQGVATALFEQGIAWAKKHNIHRLELDVWAHNKNAIKLYKKFGFKKEGVRKEGALIDGKYVDIIGMGLILD